jgi:hypothetical protein
MRGPPHTSTTFIWWVSWSATFSRADEGGASDQDVLTSRANTQLINQNALENVLVDIQFLKDQFMVVGLDKFTGVFDELVMASLLLPYPWVPLF